MEFVSQEHSGDAGEAHQDLSAGKSIEMDVDESSARSPETTLQCAYNEIVKDRNDLKEKLEAQMQQLQNMKIEYVRRRIGRIGA